MPQLKRHLTSLDTAFIAYKAVHQEIAETFRDVINPEEEDEALEQQADMVEEAEMLGQLLLSIASTAQQLAIIGIDIHKVERLMVESPDQSYLSYLTLLVEQLKVTRNRLTESAIPLEHGLRCLIAEVNSQMAELMARNLKAVPAVAPPAASYKPAAPKQRTKLPQLSLSTFHGDPMKWGEFWGHFDAAVHKNDQLNEAEKNRYLKIGHPRTGGFSSVTQI